VTSSASKVFFQGGTLFLANCKIEPPTPRQWIKSAWRFEAYHYPNVRGWLREQHIRDNVPRWSHPKLRLYDERAPHEYQNEALKAWNAHDRRGSIVLPTGAGKTLAAIHAVQEADCSTLVVAPTIDLLHQWYARLSHAFQTEIGVYYSAEKLIQPLTVTTYHLAGDLIAEQGYAFKLVIFDEVHHLVGDDWPI